MLKNGAVGPGILVKETKLDPSSYFLNGKLNKPLNFQCLGVAEPGLKWSFIEK